MEGASVRVEGRERAVVTDANGRYVIAPATPGPQVLRVERIGYATARVNVLVPVEGRLVVDVQLAIQALDVEGLVVTADPVGRAEGEVGTATVVGREAIESQMAASLRGILELAPGVPLQPPGLDGVQQISLRASPTSGSSATLAGNPSAADLTSFGTVIIVDGVPLSNNANLQTTGARGELAPPSSAGGGIDIRRIPAATLERVEVIRGLPSARYGDLTQGAIVVETRAGRVDPSLSARFDSHTREGTVMGGALLGTAQALTATFDATRTLLAPGQRDDDAYRFAAQVAHRHTVGADGAGGDGRAVFDTRLDLYRLVEDNPEDPEVAPGRASKADDWGFRLMERVRYGLGDGRSMNATLALDRSVQRSYVQSSRIRAAMPFARTLEEGRATGHFVGGRYISRVDLEGDPWLVFGRLEGDLATTALGFEHRLRPGVEFRREWNDGRGYMFDMEFPPQVSFNGVRGFDRPWPFDRTPALATSALYVDDRMSRGVGSLGLLTVQWGVRVDLLHEQGSWLRGVRDAVPQPRLATELAPSPWLRLRASAGRTAKVPSIQQLHPAPEYFDVVNVSRFSSDPAERLAVLTTFIRDPTNPDLGFSTARKAELGVDLLLGPAAAVSLVAFDDRILGGVGARPEPGFLPREHFALTDTIEGNGIPPEIVEPAVSVDTVPILVSRPANNLTLRSRGLELVATLPELRSLRLRTQLTGAWIRTRYEKDGLDVGVRFSDFQVDGRIPRIPYWEAITDRGERALLSYRLVHHQPELGLVATATVQHILRERRHSGGATDTLSFEGYLTRDGRLVPVPPSDRGNAEFGDLRLPRTGGSADSSARPDWFMSLQVSKTLPLDGRLSFFSFNALDRRGRLPEAGRLPVIIPPLRFGVELAAPAPALRRLIP